MNFTTGNLSSAQFRVSAVSGDYTVEAQVNVDAQKKVNNINDGRVKDPEGTELASFSSWAVNQLSVNYNDITVNMVEVSAVIKTFCNELRVQTPSMELVF